MLLSALTVFTQVANSQLLELARYEGRCDKAGLGLGLGLGFRLGFGFGLDLGLVLGS